jgi:hypothetical protein
MINNETKKSLEELIQEGLRSYPPALLALREFCNEIRKRAENVFRKKEEALLKAMGCATFKECPLWVYPDLISPMDWDGKWAWVAVHVWAGYLSCYFGLTFWKEDTVSDLCSYVTVMMNPGNHPRRDRILKESRNLSINLSCDNPSNEISVDLPIRPTDSESFEKKLGETIDVWIKFWTEIGGIEKLKD